MALNRLRKVSDIKSCIFKMYSWFLVDLFKELKDLENEAHTNISAGPESDSLYQWVGTIFGPVCKTNEIYI